MASVQEKLYHLNFTDDDFELTDNSDGLGPIISAWYSQQPQPSKATIDAVSDNDADSAVNTHRFRRSFDLDKKDKVIIKWIADLNGLTTQEARQQLRAIWNAL